MVPQQQTGCENCGLDIKWTISIPQNSQSRLARRFGLIAWERLLEIAYPLLAPYNPHFSRRVAARRPRARNTARPDDGAAAAGWV